MEYRELCRTSKEECGTNPKRVNSYGIRKQKWWLTGFVTERPTVTRTVATVKTWVTRKRVFFFYKVHHQSNPVSQIRWVYITFVINRRYFLLSRDTFIFTTTITLYKKFLLEDTEIKSFSSTSSTQKGHHRNHLPSPWLQTIYGRGTVRGTRKIHTIVHSEYCENGLHVYRKRHNVWWGVNVLVVNTRVL